jgi:NADPH-dependent 2,4-dienoyl-CoA reductase/sulfur reductase-like enzyme/pSer/pThr/pTyr-binding forkhead associated (FHA) protein
MAEQLSYLIIGNGVAGVTAAEILRAEDSVADITVIADDPFPVYYRPALKDYLAGRVREDKLWARPTSFYQDQRIRFVPDRVVGIQAGQHVVQLQSGRQVGYHRLLLSQGARASTLSCPGLNLAGVTTLRTVANYQAVLAQLGTARRVVVTGSGTLALETIETLRHRGYQVIHLLRRRTLWSEVLDPTASDLVLQQERRDGVDVRVEEEIAEITGSQGQVNGVVTTKGTRIACEIVLMAIGIEPIIDFVKSSGIPCGRGIKVDSAMRTPAPDIYAAGDALETTDAITGRTRVIGQWYPAIQQARAAAYSMLDLLDTSRPFRMSTFYNATFLYGLDFASVGLANMPRDGKGYQEIVADPQPRTYRKVLLKDGVPVGMLTLGDRKGVLAMKRAIDHNVNLTPVLNRLFAPDFDLRTWLDQQGVPPAVLGVTREGEAAVQQAVYGATGTAMAATAMKPQPVIEAVLVPVTASMEGVLLAETRLSQTKAVTVGRQVGIALLIDHGSVSRRHAEITYANGQYILRDLGSTNGTYVNETRLEPNSPYILKNKDQLRFGRVMRFTFQARVAGKKTSVGGTSLPGLTLQQMPTRMADQTGPLPSPGQPILNPDGTLLLPGATSVVPASIVASLKETPALIVVSRGLPDTFLLKKGERVTLGRGKENMIVLTDAVASRRHAEVLPGPDGYYIHDLESSNGVIVNQTKIDNPYRLAHGDRIAIGSTMIYFIDEQLHDLRDAELQPVGAGAVGAGLPPQAERSIAIAQPQSMARCPSCGLANTRIARFCASCGTPLAAASGGR